MECSEDNKNRNLSAVQSSIVYCSDHKCSVLHYRVLYQENCAPFCIHNKKIANHFGVPNNKIPLHFCVPNKKITLQFCFLNAQISLNFSVPNNKVALYFSFPTKKIFSISVFPALKKLNYISVFQIKNIAPPLFLPPKKLHFISLFPT